MDGVESHRDRTVVVVDDEPLVRGILIRALEHEGYRVLGAGDGRAGFELIVTTEPDLVVTDLRMPVMDGWELALLMRQHYPAIPMLFISAVCEQAAGLSGECMAKPVRVADLVERVDALIGRKAVERLVPEEESRVRELSP